MRERQTLFEEVCCGSSKGLKRRFFTMGTPSLSIGMPPPVRMARAYSVTREDVAAWQQVERAVWETLGLSLIAKVVHVQSVLRRDIERTTLRKEYLSDVSLTTAGLGMIWEQQALQPKLGGILGRKKAS
jgi:hypothetical protein